MGHSWLASGCAALDELTNIDHGRFTSIAQAEIFAINECIEAILSLNLQGREVIIFHWQSISYGSSLVED